MMISEAPLSVPAEAAQPIAMESPVLTAHLDEPDSNNSTPRKHIDSRPLPTDSLISIPLSDTDRTRPPTIAGDETTSEYRASTATDSEQRYSWRDSNHSSEEMDDRRSSEGSVKETLAEEIRQNSGVVSSASTSPESRARTDSMSSTESIGVDWEQLDMTEAREDADADSDEQTRLLLARLEQENNMIAIDPKAGVRNNRLSTQSRPPSVHQLKKLVQEQGARSVRFSLLPAAAPMTELDFWAALVRDYLPTAQRLPTITSNKIRAGIPAPLRGVVWVSMAGARELTIEEQYDRLSGESSPYENIISKDIGRSFPGVEMFRDPNGEGQIMLGRVLKAFSLYDDKIGYCQGLGFLVGPLLMNMGDKQAFCVLVRLMEDYDLRSCFLPDLSGLHLRIYQFNALLHQHVPKVAAHLDLLGVEGAYLSQWFLSFFAVTCPLPLLFRIYDVIFAEGASETLMRVALAIMHKNEKKLLGFTEFEEAMQLLLSRALWDPYGLSATSADDMVSDLVSFTSVVTRESLSALEADFRAQSGEAGAKANLLPDVQSTASRFLGRLWTSSHSHTPSKSNIFSPGLTAPDRPKSNLLRTPSKQSLITLNSIEGSSDGSSNTSSAAMTELTEMSRESSVDCISMKSVKSMPTESMASSLRTTMNSKDKEMHTQIEDLLTALTEMQREHALLAQQLQQEREERTEDHRAVRTLVNGLREDVTADPSKESTRRAVSECSPSPSIQLPEMIVTLVERVETRLVSNKRRSSGYETKAQLRSAVATMKEQLSNERNRSSNLSRQVSEKEQESSSLREDLSRARIRIKDGHVEKQRLEKVVQELRQASRNTTLSARSRSGSQTSTSEGVYTPSRSDTGQSDLSVNSGGLREFRLMRSLSKEPDQPRPPQSTFSKRTSSLNTQAILATENHAPPAEETLLLELVNAKTAEAVAKQELEEMRAKFEAMRKMLNVSVQSTPSPEPIPRASSRTPNEKNALPVLTPGSTKSFDSSKTTTPASGTWGAAGGGFFSWGKK
ncbi:hypothetical protein EJ08DRAFT_146071 [Tothia fuscella]|uniref:Rab-GAP TBC domain-containing protein n=1 Tax=Tothia fuscella TaxID=1048955 RepID=A0A9P4U334_9PEZI|nr:hypothetical protein EJ08DRAFT_146071 [Tothia fuscella]